MTLYSVNKTLFVRLGKERSDRASPAGRHRSELGLRGPAGARGLKPRALPREEGGAQRGGDQGEEAPAGDLQSTQIGKAIPYVF